ncbi:MAG TPA: helix-turn-helix transcriptional regulator [Candidatus Dormibacteraeota bacterium]|nr:helix-turn-helix transcriptional regulator [Candidatus Dormibacteraeota bacterium]
MDLLLACRQALIRRQVEGRIVSMESLAEAAGCSRSTASRFFAGRVNNLKTTLLILEQLGLQGSWSRSLRPWPRPSP